MALLASPWATNASTSTSTVAEVAVSLAQPWPLRYLVDTVLQPAGGVRPENAQRLIILSVGAMALLVVTGALIHYWASRLLSTAGLRIASDLRTSVLTSCTISRCSITPSIASATSSHGSRATSTTPRT